MGEKKGKKQTSTITNRAIRRVKQGFATVGAGAFVLGATAITLLGGGKGAEKDAASWQEAFDNFSKPAAHTITQDETSSDVISAITTAPATTEKIQTENGTIEVKTQEVVTTENQPAIFITVKDNNTSKEEKIAEYLQNVKESKASTETESENKSQAISAEEIKSQIKVTTTRPTKSEQRTTEQPKVEESVKTEKPTGYILEDVKSPEQEEVAADQTEKDQSTSFVDMPTENTRSNETKVDLSLSKNANIDDFAKVEVYSDSSAAISVSKNKGLMLSFAAGPSLVVTGKGINFDLAMGLALSTNISEHAQFYASVVAGTGVPLGQNATLGDLLSNGAAVASVGVKISWGGQNVKFTPDLLSVGSAIRHNVKNGGANNPATPDNTKGNISYDTGHYDNNSNGSIGKDNGESFPGNPFPDNDSFGFDFER